MELDRAEAIVKELLNPQYLNSTQVMVFSAAWVGQSYGDLAQSAGYDPNYLKGVGAQVWKMLATATGCRVSKRNFRQVLESLDARIDSVPRPQFGIDWENVVDVPAFYGREVERRQLNRWIVTDRCQLVAILGMGGMGKTTTAIELVRQLQASVATTTDPDRFSQIVWRSLLNAPPLKEILPELIQTLTCNVATKLDSRAERLHQRFQRELLPETVGGQIELLLAVCQTSRCLIVLDNGESILQAGAQVGQYRDGYADYGDLFTSLGRSDHQSCLLLTSREKPTEISQIEATSTKVRTLVLPGLTAAAGQQIFVDRSCEPISPVTWVEIDRYCGGNPLAFQLIATAVREVAAGDVNEIYPYLQSSTLGLADVNMLLEQQWERLTAAEQQVMYSLAICREPIQAIDLQRLLHPEWHRHQPCDYQPDRQAKQPASNSSLLTVLQSLRRRHIIYARSVPTDQSQRYWSLQPMVMEYVTGRFVDRIAIEIDRQTPFLLDTHPIIQANTTEYLRQAQLRLIVIPTIDRLLTRIGNTQQIGTHLRLILATWQIANSQQPGYLAGNLLNFLTYLKLDLTELDCSELVIQQAYLVGIDLARVNFTNAQIVDCAFNQTFSSILAIAYSPDGQTLAASDSNGEIKLWCVRDRHCLVTFTGHTNWVRAIRFSPDGRYLASTSDDRTIALWDLQSGSCIKTIGAGIHSLGFSFSPDGRYIASGSANNTIYYWDIQTGTCVREFIGHQDWSVDVKFHPDGDRFVSGGADGTVRVWDVASGRCDRILTDHQNWVTTVDYSPDGKTVLSGSLDGNLRLWDSTERACRLVVTGHGDEIWSAVFSPDGKTFASAGVGGLLRIWRTSDGHCLHYLAGHSKQLWSVAFHPNGHELVSGGEDRAICWWRVKDGKCLYTIEGWTNGFRSLAWNPTGDRLITASHDTQIRVWSVRHMLDNRSATANDSANCLQQLLGHTKSTLAVAADPHGRTFASGSDDCTIGIWDAATFCCLQVLRGHSGSILALVYSPDGKYLVSAGSDLSIRIWDTQSWQCLNIRTGHTDRIGGLAYHPQLDLFASAGEDSTIRIWQLHNPQPIHVLSHATNRAIAVAFDPRGTILASGGMDRQIQLWNIETGELTQTLTGHSGWILSLAYSPDGQWLYSGASDNTIKIWSVATGIWIDTLVGHQSWVWSVSVSACGQFLASASEDENIRIWDAVTGHLLATRRAARPYEGMNITGIKGLTAAQIDGLKILGAG